jgi:hypothetical protein
VGHAPALTVAYDAVAGTELWATHYSGPIGDEGNNAVVVNLDGTHAFVTGGGQSGNADFATLSYSTGAPASGPVQLVKVVSSKVHGSAGTFEIELPQAEVNLNPGIECRTGGPNGDYTIIFTFATPLTAVVDATTSCGIVSASAIDSTDAHRYILNLTGVTCNAIEMRVSLINVFDSAGNFSKEVPAIFGLLIGDVNSSRRVDAADVSLVRQQTLQPITSSNFRADINASGRIDAADVSIARQQTLTSLPQ